MNLRFCALCVDFIAIECLIIQSVESVKANIVHCKVMAVVVVKLVTRLATVD